MVDHVKENAMNPNIKEFDEIFTRDFAQMEDKTDLNVMLEKLSILTHLFSREFQQYLEGDQESSLIN